MVAAGLELARVALLSWRAASGDRWVEASGYLTGPSTVLTAAHAVEGTETLEVSLPLRESSEHSWRPARVSWRPEPGWRSRGDPDIALLTLDEPLVGVPLSRIAHPGVEAGVVPFVAVGFPRFRLQDSRPVRVRDTIQADGHLVRGGLARSARWDLRLDMPALPEGGGGAWAGMSGAAVVSGGCVVGVVDTHAEAEGSLALTAARLHPLLSDPRFCEVLTEGSDTVFLDDPWGMLEPPYRRLPDEALRSPANLLRPEHAVVPFHEQGSDLSDLMAWLHGPSRWAALVLHGPGGAGKTRLAAEVVDRAGRHGWLAGLVPIGSPSDCVLPLVASGLPLLLVVDEAHTRPTELLAAMLQTLADAPQPTRVLLLARTAGGWLTERLAQAAARSSGVATALTALTVRPVDSIATRPETRVAAFDAARVAFARRLGRARISADGVDLLDPSFASILLVHVAALARVLSDDEGGPSTSATADLLDWLLLREAAVWTARSGGLPDDAGERLPGRLVGLAAMVAMAPPDDGATARRTLAALPELEDASQLILTRLDEWLQSAYPGTGRWPPLGPDLLADRLLARLLDDEDFGVVPERLVSLAGPEQLRSVLQVLSRIAVAGPDGDHLSRLLSDLGRLETLIRRLGPDEVAAAVSAALVGRYDPRLEVLQRVILQTRVALDGDPAQLLAQLSARLAGEPASAARALLDEVDAAPGPRLRARTEVLRRTGHGGGVPWTFGAARIGALALGLVHGQQALAVGADGEVHVGVLDAAALQVSRVLVDPPARVNAAVLAQVGDDAVVLVATNAGPGIHRLRVEEAELVEERISLDGYQYAGSLAAATVDGETWVAATTLGEELGAWRLASGHPVDGLPRFTQCVAVGSVGNGLVVVERSRDNGLEVRDIRTGEPLGPPVPLRDRWVRSVSVGEIGTGGLLAIAWNEVEVDVIDIATGSPLGAALLAPGRVRGLACGGLDDRAVVALGTIDGLVQVLAPGEQQRGPGLSTALDATVRAVGVLDGRTVALVQDAGRLVLADPFTGAELDDHPNPATVARLLVDDPTVDAATVVDGSTVLRDPGRSAPRRASRRRVGRARPVRELDRSRPDGWPEHSRAYGYLGSVPVCAIGSLGGVAWLWSLEDGRLLGGPYSPDGPPVAVFDVPVKRELPSPVTDVAVGWLGDAPAVVLACDGELRAYDPMTGRRLASPPRDPGTHVLSVCLGRFGDHPVLVFGTRRTLVVHHGQTMARLAAVSLDAPVTSVVVVSGADQVAARTEDRLVHVFDVVLGPAAP
jgi:hypothetical protein